MQKHTMKRICRVADINAEFLTFRLTKEQRAKANGAKISFRKSTQRYEGYRQLLARAEYNKLNPATGKKHATPVASKLIGIIWNDDPDWVYETDKTKSSKPERRKQAIAKRFESQRNLTTQVASLFTEDIEYQVSAVQVKKIPVPLFLTVAVICACRGLTDATSVANYWNDNLTSLRNLFPSYELEVISHDTVRRIYMSLTENSVRNFMKNFYDWLPKWSDGERRHYAVDVQSCRASRHFETNRRMMTLNAVDITAGKLCSSHLMISTKSHEPKYAPELLADFQIHGATVTLDALNTTTEVAYAIVNAGGFYLLAVKENQPKLHNAVIKEIDKAIAVNEALEQAMKLKSEHGRTEGRGYVVVPSAGLSKEILEKWPGLAEGCLIKARTHSFRSNGSGEWGSSDEIRYFITCHPYGDGSITEWLITCVRSHWGIESFHWTMDAIWRQDQMQCMYPEYLRTRGTLAKLGHNLLVTLRKIEQLEQNLREPRSETQLSHEVGVTFENGLAWLERIFRYKAKEES